MKIVLGDNEVIDFEYLLKLESKESIAGRDEDLGLTEVLHVRSTSDDLMDVEYIRTGKNAECRILRILIEKPKI